VGRWRAKGRAGHVGGSRGVLIPQEASPWPPWARPGNPWPPHGDPRLGPGSLRPISPTLCALGPWLALPRYMPRDTTYTEAALRVRETWNLACEDRIFDLLRNVNLVERGRTGNFDTCIITVLHNNLFSNTSTSVPMSSVPMASVPMPVLEYGRTEYRPHEKFSHPSTVNLYTNCTRIEVEPNLVRYFHSKSVLY
jgi:hypothetical protein